GGTADARRRQPRQGQHEQTKQKQPPLFVMGGPWQKTTDHGQRKQLLAIGLEADLRVVVGLLVLIEAGFLEDLECPVRLRPFHVFRQFRAGRRERGRVEREGKSEVAASRSAPAANEKRPSPKTFRFLPAQDLQSSSCFGRMGLEREGSDARAYSCQRDDHPARQSAADRGGLARSRPLPRGPSLSARTHPCH